MSRENSSTLNKTELFGSLPPHLYPYRPINTLALKKSTPKTFDLSNDIFEKNEAEPPLDIGSSFKLIGNRNMNFNWRPKGQLIGTLHGHNTAVNEIHVSPDQMFFTTASEDGTIKIWDCSDFEDKVDDSSIEEYKTDGKLITMTMLNRSNSFAAAYSDNTIKIIRVDLKSSSNDSRPKDFKYQRVLLKSIDTEDGCIVKLDHIDSFSDSILFYGIDKGIVNSYDIRSNKSPFRFEIEIKYGYITSMIVDPNKNWVIISTLRGYIICWDLRNNIPLYYYQLEDSNPIFSLHSIAYDVDEDKIPILITIGNGRIIEFDIRVSKIERIISLNEHEDQINNIPRFIEDNSSQSVLKSIRKDLYQLSSPTYEVKKLFRAVMTTPIARNTIFTAGADKIIRCWDLNNPSKSYIVSNPTKHIKRLYSQTNVDGISIIQERVVGTNKRIQDDLSTNLPHTFHQDTILSLASIENPTRILLSSSKDGTVRVWK